MMLHKIIGLTYAFQRRACEREKREKNEKGVMPHALHSGFYSVGYVTLAPIFKAPLIVRISLREVNLLLYRIFIIAILVLSPVVNSYAEKTVDLFNTSALVVNQTPEVRRQAVERSLRMVLVRLSGNTETLSAPEIQGALQRATDYLERFTYQSTNQTLTIAGAQQAATLLIMQFNGAELINLLKQSRQSVWQASRPDVLVWTATDTRGKKYVDIDSEMAKALSSAAIKRGLPIVIPVLDLEDRAALTVSRLWAIDESSVRKAAARYATNAVLSGRFTVNQNLWKGNFILIHKDKNTYLTASGNNQSEVAAEIVDQVTDYFAQIYSVSYDAIGSSNNLPINANSNVNSVNTSVERVGGQTPIALPFSRDPRSFYIQVSNIQGFEQYIALMNYLDGLALVDSITIANAQFPRLLLDVKLSVGEQQFLSTLELDKRLQRVSSGAAINGSEQAPEFVWR